ncbi:MAG: SdrD B-like domain-containing protein, partial [Candidatus Omnitrophica bacterium]|nr:SdrD B-like domain-containing protein [Candidatus Omnitrophota bacterium]
EQKSPLIKEEMLTAGQKTAYAAATPAIMPTILPKTQPVAFPFSAQGRYPELIPQPGTSATTEINKVLPPTYLVLDESLKAGPLRTVDIEQNKTIILIGKNIQRFLASQPDTLQITKQDTNQLFITGKKLGFTNLIVWDDNGRWTLEFLTTPPQPEGPTMEEQIRLEQERAGDFKLRYYVDWSTFESGRRVHSLKRLYYYYNHLLTLTGETPYGDLDSTMAIRTLNGVSDITTYTIGLQKGRFLSFKDFALRIFDFDSGISNLAFTSQTLRGIFFDSPMFNKMWEYSVFWGRQFSGLNANLSPGSVNLLDSFLAGFNLNFKPNKMQNYRFSIFRGYGSDRKKDISDLNPWGYDLGANYRFQNWGIDYEIANDSQHFGNLFNLIYKTSKLNISSEFRDIDKDFLSMTGIGDRAGEIGVLTTANYKPQNNLYVNGQLNVFRDRRFPAEDNPRRWNEDFNGDVTYLLDQLTSVRFDYILQNELGRLGQVRYLSPGLGLNRTFKVFDRLISTFLNYRFQRNQNFTAPALDYQNDKIIGGIRFSLIGNLYYYINREMNWLKARGDDGISTPQATETGVDWSGQFFNTQLYPEISFSYRQEDHTDSPLSFLSGEDYILGYLKLSYRFDASNEAYLSARVRNIWAGNPNIVKRVEAEFNGGMRYLWDTGVKWESVGRIEGYVFRDLNSDGLRQKDEPPVEGIKLLLGKDRSSVTDIFGYYVFEGVKGKKAYVSFDTSTLPSGFVLTTPALQETFIVNHGYARLDFGIISRSEITGYIFEDVENTGEFTNKSVPVQGVVLILENGKKILSDATGRYSFSNISTGDHTVTLDLNSLPVYYLPKTSITKKVTLSEGVTYIYNIPLKRTQQQNN